MQLSGTQLKIFDAAFLFLYKDNPGSIVGEMDECISYCAQTDQTEKKMPFS